MNIPVQRSLGDARAWRVLAAVICLSLQHVAVTQARPRLAAGLGARAAAAGPLAVQPLTGSTQIWVTGVRGARRAVLTLDRKRVAALALRRGALRPWAFDTTRIADGPHVLIARVTRRHGSPLTLRAAFRVDNSGPGSDQLIAQALAAHRIDYGTSLLDRFYALWQPGRLPASLRGGPATDDTIAFAASAALANGQVTGSEAQKLRRFLLRPTDPRSPFHTSGLRVRAHAAADSCDVAAGNATVGTEAGAGDARTWTWQDLRDSAWVGAFRWVQKLASADIAREEADMGAAKPDGPQSCAKLNPTPAVDVYLVDGPAISVSRDPRYVASAGAYAVTVPNCTPAGCSAFILFNIAATGAGQDMVDTILTHELFHVLENAKVTGYTLSDDWFTEASATWAEGHYEPQNPAAASYSNTWFETFQTAPRTIGQFCLGDEGCPYEQWIWPYFMTQEGASVARAWDALAHVQNNDDATHALDQVFPFAAHFRDFAVRDLQVDYHEQGASTAGLRFQSGWKPIAATEPSRSDGSVPIVNTDDKDQTFDARAPGSLDYATQEFTLPDKSQVRHVQLSFTGLTPDTDVDVLVHIAGQSDLERRRLSAPEFDFCRDKAGDDIDRIVAIYSNHSVLSQDAGDATMHYRSSGTCGAVTEWKGTYTARDTETSDNEDWEFSGTVDYVLDKASSNVSSWTYRMDPNTPIHVTMTGSTSQCTLSGSGTVRANAVAELTVESPHDPGATYGANAITNDTIPVLWHCADGDHTIDELPRGDFQSGVDPFSTDATTLAGTWDSGPIQGGQHDYSTWHFTAAATGDAP